MSNRYNYGEEVSYKFEKVEPEDMEKLQAFSCGNDILDQYIRQDIFDEGEDGRVVKCEDGLHFKVLDVGTNEIVGFVSLATSGIIHKQGTYTHLLPAIKIDVFAIDERYQKMHYNQESEESDAADEHYYFSDDVMGTVLCHCREIDDNYALVNYIILYADESAERFYRRNLFEDYREFMEQEHNQEISKNIPMYMEL